MNLILASSSKSRKAVFDMLGFQYKVIVSKEEEVSNKIDFSEYVMELSKIKANSVFNQLNKEKALIVAADSIICMKNRKFGKPKDINEAYENIRMLSGSINYALTGVTIKDLYQEKEISFFDKTEVYFKNVDEEDIKWYVDNDKHILERAGYSIAEGKAAIFVDKIIGDYYNIIGMPVGKLYDNFKKLGYKIKDFRGKN